MRNKSSRMGIIPFLQFSALLILLVAIIYLYSQTYEKAGKSSYYSKARAITVNDRQLESIKKQL